MPDEINDNVSDASIEVIELNVENAEIKSETELETKIEPLSDEEIKEVADRFNEQRTIHELETLRDSYGLGDGNPNIEQIAGMYKDIKGSTLNGEVGEAHHIIPQSLVESDKKHGTSIELEKQDHRDLPTTGGIINRTYESFLPDSPKDSISHRDEITALMEKDLHAEAFRNEILDIMKNEYDKGKSAGKYDGAIKAAINAEIDFIDKYGVPKPKE